MLFMNFHTIWRDIFILWSERFKKYNNENNS